MFWSWIGGLGLTWVSAFWIASAVRSMFIINSAYRKFEEETGL
jgi:hypothetical protein